MTLTVNRLSIVTLIVLFFFMLLSVLGVLSVPLLVYVVWLGIGLLLLVTGN